jgi:SAM-dependent methyltransferase
VSIYLPEFFIYLRQLILGDRTRHEQMLAEQRQLDIEPYVDSNHPYSILDLANGRLRPQYTILKAAGHHVYGIDMVNRPQWSKTDIAYRVARAIYNWKLGVPRRALANQTLACGDVGLLPFPDNYFDLATSVAAFEHFLDVPRVVAELHRVIRPGGVVWVCLHLFTSPSGGHNVSFTEIPLRTIPAGVEPWDHLRKRQLPFHVPLNEWCQNQYLETFASHFEIIKEYCWMREGQEFLTPAIEAELSDYSRDELTCGALVIVARKP